MITARNYASQTIRSLNKILKKTPPSEADTLKKCINDIEDAIKFVIPDTGRILYDGQKGLEGKCIRLPFPIITVEFHVPSAMLKMLILAKEGGDGWGEIYTFGGWDETIYPICNVPGTWDLQREYKKTVADQGYFLFQQPHKVVPWLDGAISKSFNTPVHAIYGFRHLMELIEALSCRNITTANYQEASPANAKRIKQGKLPIYETKMLVVDTKAAVTASGEYKGGSQSSPRQHLRRGHIRHHPTAGNIWIQSCVVGDPTKGTIAKQYAVV